MAVHLFGGFLQDQTPHQQHQQVGQVAEEAAHHAQQLNQYGEKRLIDALLQIQPRRPAVKVAPVLHQHLADEQEVHRHADGEGDHHALEIHPGEIVYGMVEGVPTGKVQGQPGQLFRQTVGQQSDHGQRHACQRQRQHGQRRTPFFAAAAALLPEDRHIDFGQIRRRQAAGEKEQPFHGGYGGTAGEMDILHDGLVHQRLAQITAEARDTCQ